MPKKTPIPAWSDTDIAVHVSMLGGFRLQAGGHEVDESRNRARQLWNLLEYLIAFRHRDISPDELVDVLWHEDEIDNPSSALKNLVYRIRTILVSHNIPYAKDMILCRRSTYSWNNALSTTVDIEEFERLIREADDKSSSPAEQLDLYLEALTYYKGDLLPKSSFEEWVVPLSTYYHSLYVKCVAKTVQLLANAGRHQEIVDIAEQAIVIDQFEESFHEALICALIAIGNQQRAMTHYEYVTNLFYRELGVKPSERLRSLYREIIKNVQHVETDLEIIKEDLREASLARGAFFCEYEVFKNIYQLEMRSAERTGQPMFLLLLTISCADGQVPSRKLLNTSIERLRDCLRICLRRSDVVARFSATQFVALLSSLTFENSMMVQERILNRFKRENARLAVQIHAKLQPMDPGGMPVSRQ
ncbi:MAG: BTAD domain-containing putative transcriptional regulator [Oscillospiraceae bacterium]|nr:BTAD domain-containing putative transcriptional regulator [Oscillospiraceae bacterium]